MNKKTYNTPAMRMVEMKKRVMVCNSPLTGVQVQSNMEMETDDDFE